MRARTDSSASTPTAELEQNDLDLGEIFDDTIDNTVDQHIEAGAGGTASSCNALDDTASILGDPRDFNFEEAMRWLACSHYSSNYMDSGFTGLRVGLGRGRHMITDMDMDCKESDGSPTSDATSAADCIHGVPICGFLAPVSIA